MTFEQWWHDKGSGLPPLANEDHEMHVGRVSKLAFEAGVREGIKQAELNYRDILAEASWKERQGEDYGSF